jgi:hypothetical protein
MGDYVPPPSTATALSAVRALPSGEARGYTTVEGPYRLIERTVRTAWHVGYVTRAGEDSYAVIDVIDDNSDIIADYGVPHARAFQW